jgi:hypothetical protein
MMAFPVLLFRGHGDTRNDRSSQSGNTAGPPPAPRHPGAVNSPNRQKPAFARKNVIFLVLMAADVDRT